MAEPQAATENSAHEGGSTTAGETTPDAGAEFKAITTQDDLNKVITDRVNRERAKYADYKDVKAKAARLDEIEEANKSEAQKLSDAKTVAERERDEARTEALRLRIATKHGISDEDADLFLTGSDQESLTKQAERLAQRSEDRKKKSNVVPGEGKTPGSTDTDRHDFVRRLTGRA